MATESAHQERSNYDEILMQHRINFTASLKELKNLRKQLYSAAEYFELSYGKDEHKQELVDTMKGYVSKALISTVDHLGSVASKLDTFLDEKVDEFSATKLRFSCIEQRSKSCQEFVDSNGVVQQSFVTVFPKHMKHYVNPGSAEDTVSDLCKPIKKTPKKTIFYPRDDMHQNQHQQGYCFPSPFLATIKQHPILSRRRLQNNPAFTEPSPNPPAFSFTRAASSKELGKQSVSPLRFRLKRSGSYIPRSTPPSACNKQQCPPDEPRRTFSMPINLAKATSQNMQLHSINSKRVLKSLRSFQFTD